MVIEGYEADCERKWPLGPDLVEECQLVDDLPKGDPDSWDPLFEPNNFTEAYGPLEVEKYRLSPIKLEEWAKMSVELRGDIVKRAKKFVEEEPTTVAVSYTHLTLPTKRIV